MSEFAGVPVRDLYRVDADGDAPPVPQHRCDLMGQFEAVKNYFLLGRGDFYQQFLDEVGVTWL